MKRTAYTLMLVGSLLIGGCVSPSTESTDADANYQEVFSGVAAAKPVIVHSHVEELHRAVMGVVPMSEKRTGQWQFELIVSPEWLAEVKPRFTEIAFADSDYFKWPLPPWFKPKQDKFSAWAINGPSYPLSHLFIEKNPQSPQQIRVFIRRF